MTYEIQISEEQRVVLMEAMRLANQLRAPGEEADLVEGMLFALPAMEEESPGALHSFVL